MIFQAGNLTSWVFWILNLNGYPTELYYISKLAWYSWKYVQTCVRFDLRKPFSKKWFTNLQ